MCEMCSMKDTSNTILQFDPPKNEFFCQMRVYEDSLAVFGTEP